MGSIMVQENINKDSLTDPINLSNNINATNESIVISLKNIYNTKENCIKKEL